MIQFKQKYQQLNSNYYEGNVKKKYVTYIFSNKFSENRIMTNVNVRNS